MLNQWLEYLENQVGKGVYVWGAQGQRADSVGNVQDFIMFRSKTNVMGGRAWKFYQEMEEKIGKENISFFDCSGLAMYFFQNMMGVAGSDATADGIWGGCKEISKQDICPGDFSFRKENGSMVHIGFVAADGNIIEARSSGYGVEKRPVPDGKWTHFGRHRWLRDEIEGKTGANDGDQEMAKNIERLQRTLLCFDAGCLPKYGTDGKYGKETDAAVKKMLDWIENIRNEAGYAGK